MNPDTVRVALLIESSHAYGRGLLAGIYDHATVGEHWVTFLPEHGRGAPPLESLHAWRRDGIIARIENERIAAVVREPGLTIVELCDKTGLTYMMAETVVYAREVLFIKQMAEKLVSHYGSPFAIESAYVKLRGSPVVARVIRIPMRDRATTGPAPASWPTSRR